MYSVLLKFSVFILHLLQFHAVYADVPPPDPVLTTDLALDGQTDTATLFYRPDAGGANFLHSGNGKTWTLQVIPMDNNLPSKTKKSPKVVICPDNNAELQLTTTSIDKGWLWVVRMKNGMLPIRMISLTKADHNVKQWQDGTNLVGSASENTDMCSLTNIVPFFAGNNTLGNLYWMGTGVHTHTSTPTLCLTALATKNRNNILKAWGDGSECLTFNVLSVPYPQSMRPKNAPPEANTGIGQLK